MKTYLMVWFNSEGVKPTKVLDSLTSMGFKPMHGSYDFVYSWPERPDVDETLALGDKVQQTLKGMKVMFKMESL